ncbi:peptidyl-prolyl cis-trans isomerase [Paraburkholderia sprentiae WSM5005]|uniref:peptidylprolyl isomerase n=1 Tax=Paraburkholderia sprentiae WSM5005 TaxID=754502 RepID=A0A1I9YQR9_9BURK|nr:peptidylprolyl isomerase [Paraburkholderia sprentiae]APA88559.2 peptidyl-prolyl cis-trans isomerase [Paraburkholderia sprentiae WSM5005]
MPSSGLAAGTDEDSNAAATLSVNGVAIDAAALAEEARHHADAADPLAASRRALVVRELLRQRARALELIEDAVALDDAALDRLLQRELSVPAATRADCERYYASHASRFRRNEIVYASHILFAVTAHTPLALIRGKAEATLGAVLAAPDSFEAVAREVSNCPSGAVGGSLGQLLRGDSVPEFERALFDTQETGLLPRLVNTRFGFHIVRIERRVAGVSVAFEDVEAQIAEFLDERVRHKAMQQYVTILASRARIEGIELGEANGPLVQ